MGTGKISSINNSNLQQGSYLFSTQEAAPHVLEQRRSATHRQLIENKFNFAENINRRAEKILTGIADLFESRPFSWARSKLQGADQTQELVRSSITEFISNSSAKMFRGIRPIVKNAGNFIDSATNILSLSGTIADDIRHRNFSNTIRELPKTVTKTIASAGAAEYGFALGGAAAGALVSSPAIAFGAGVAGAVAGGYLAGKALDSLLDTAGRTISQFRSRFLSIL